MNTDNLKPMPPNNLTLGDFDLILDVIRKYRKIKSDAAYITFRSTGKNPDGLDEIDELIQKVGSAVYDAHGYKPGDFLVYSGPLQDSDGKMPMETKNALKSILKEVGAIPYTEGALLADLAAEVERKRSRG